MQVRILTLNLAGLNFAWFERRAEAAFAAIRRLSPDVVCLQETTMKDCDYPYDQSRALGEAAGLPHVAFASYGNLAEATSLEHGGIAIVSQWPFLEVRDRRLPQLPGDPEESREALFATIAAPGGEISVINTHLSWRPQQVETRRVQMEAILREVKLHHWGALGARFVLAGDVNATEDEPAVRRAAEELVDAWRAVEPEAPGWTWDPANPYASVYGDSVGRRLDYVFVPRGARVLKASLEMLAAEPVVPSDHYALMVDVAWR